MNKVDEETALNEFERFAEIFEISTDVSDLDDKDTADFMEFRRKFVDRVKRGVLCINDSNCVEFTPKGKSKPLILDEPMASLVSVKRPKDTDGQAMRRILAQWAGEESSYFSDVTFKDFNFCGQLFGFLANS